MKELWNRFIALVSKLISVKGTIFILATVFLFFEKIDVFTWGFFAAAFVGIRTLEKFVKRG